MKEYVLITGASSGIGFELAKLFAEEGYPLLIISGNQARLQSAYKELSQIAKADIKMFTQDLSEEGAAKELYNKIKDKSMEINILINNAGVGYAGEFVKDSYDNQQAMMTLNMTNLVLLTHCIAKDMCVKRKGRILNVASNGAFQPGPYVFRREDGPL